MADDIVGDHRALTEAVQVMAVEAVLAPGATLASASGDQVLDVLALGSAICDAAEVVLGEGVVAARQRQCSWADIGRPWA